MAKHLLLSIALFVVLGLIQVLICNNINLLNVATPFIFIYPLIRLPLTLHKNWTMTIAFAMGLTIDVFSNTQGMNALACVVLAALRDPMIKLYTTHDDEITDPVPSPKSLGIAPYMKYLFSMTLCFCIAITFIEAFTLRNFLVSLYRVIGCTLITFIILVGIDAITNAKNEKRL